MANAIYTVAQKPVDNPEFRHDELLASFREFDWH
jgi:hypothetical protein